MGHAFKVMLGGTQEERLGSLYGHRPRLSSYVYICMYVLVCFLCVCMYGWMYVWMYVCMYAFVCVYEVQGTGR